MAPDWTPPPTLELEVLESEAPTCGLKTSEMTFRIELKPSRLTRLMCEAPPGGGAAPQHLPRVTTSAQGWT